MNLLSALDALLAEGSVTGAARRLGLSSSAMSRTLARLRSTTGDPLLVRAGRGLVPTPHATELRDRVHQLTREVRTALSPHASHLDVASLERTFAKFAPVKGSSNGSPHRLCSCDHRRRAMSACVSRPSPRRMLFHSRDGQIDLEDRCARSVRAGGEDPVLVPRRLHRRGPDRTPVAGRTNDARTLRGVRSCRGVAQRGIHGASRRRAGGAWAQTRYRRTRAPFPRCDAHRARNGLGRACATFGSRQPRKR